MNEVALKKKKKILKDIFQKRNWSLVHKKHFETTESDMTSKVQAINGKKNLTIDNMFQNS